MTLQYPEYKTTLKIGRNIKLYYDNELYLTRDLENKTTTIHFPEKIRIKQLCSKLNNVASLWNLGFEAWGDKEDIEIVKTRVSPDEDKNFLLFRGDELTLKDREK